MKLKHLAAAALLAFGAASAQAGTALSTLSVDSPLGEAPGFFGAWSLWETGSFSYAYNFTLDTLSDLTGSLTVNYGDTTFSDLSINGTSVTLSPTNSFSFEDLSVGSHTLMVSGVSNSNGYLWGGYIMAEPVPEPHTVAMMLAGLGLMGAVVARRRRFQ